MTLRERLLAVYRGQTPDRVPALADLSYWHAAHGGGKFIPGKTDGANRDKIDALLALHRQTNTAIHLNLGSFYTSSFAAAGRVSETSGIRGEHYVHRYETSVGCVEEVRQWSDATHSWPITHHMVQRAEDLKVVRHVFEHVRYSTAWDSFSAVRQRVGEQGVVLVQPPYTGMGFFVSRYAGVERTVMLALDEPDEFEQTLQTINAAHEKVFAMLCDGPSEVMIVSDNLSSDVQSPNWFNRYSGAHYRRMASLAHAQGKPLVTHIDGRLRGLLRATAECGIDGADAVTPAPWGDLTPQQCRDEAGPAYILSGGVPPDAFGPGVAMSVFDQRCEQWLALRHRSPALIIAPGDQLPPDGEIERVTRMAQMAESASG